MIKNRFLISFLIQLIHGDNVRDKDFLNNILFDRELSEEQVKLLNSQIRKFLSIRALKLDGIQYQLYLDDNKRPYFTKDTLVYGTEYSEEVVDNIAKEGLIASEFNGIPKVDENYYCVTFKKVSSDVLISSPGKNFVIDDKMPFGKINDRIAFVVNPSSKIGGLLYYDLMDSKFDLRADVKGIIGRQKQRNLSSSALLVGVPKNCISGIVLGDRLLLEDKIINKLERLFPLAYIVSSSGEVIRDRSNKIVVEDFDRVSFSSAKRGTELKLMKIDNKNLEEENKKLKRDFKKIINSIKDNTSYYNQAKIYRELGYNVPKGLLKNLTKEEIRSLDM